jgi:hypothetical protein
VQAPDEPRTLTFTLGSAVANVSVVEQPMYSEFAQPQEKGRVYQNMSDPVIQRKAMAMQAQVRTHIGLCAVLLSCMNSLIVVVVIVFVVVVVVVVVISSSSCSCLR